MLAPQLPPQPGRAPGRGVSLPESRRHVPALEDLLKPNPRLRLLRPGEPDPEGRCILYWMQRSQRGRDNPALNLAIELGLAFGLPILAVFGLTARFPMAGRRHYRFLLEGLVDAKTDLARRQVPLVVRIGEPAKVVLAVARETRAAVVVGDENPVKIGEVWRQAVARALRVPLVLVDADVVVPTSLFPNEEYAARTIRPKIHRVWEQYLKPIPNPKASIPWREAAIPRGEALDVKLLLEQLSPGGAGEVPHYRGGTAEAIKRLRRFVSERLPVYDAGRNDPNRPVTSELSAHLHFGQISPVTIALAARASGAPRPAIDAFLEELIVRRELAVNFVARNSDYDRLAGCPFWARATLVRHAADPRPVIYSTAQFEAAETHDPLWNAAQREMVLTGRMHGYLRMYWAKKILHWSPDAQTALAIALALNDCYQVDGRDPNGYTGIAWAIGGKHDRAWPERPIFGTVRFMSYESTSRKFDAKAYIARIDAIEGCGVEKA
jgi:deoxyribodipyrimidine photo-lyase